MAGGKNDWEALINHQSSLLTETKNLLGETKKILDEAQKQSKHSRWVLILAILTLLATVCTTYLASVSS